MTARQIFLCVFLVGLLLFLFFYLFFFLVQRAPRQTVKGKCPFINPLSRTHPTTAQSHSELSFAHEQRLWLAPWTSRFRARLLPQDLYRAYSSTRLRMSWSLGSASSQGPWISLRGDGITRRPYKQNANQYTHKITYSFPLNLLLVPLDPDKPVRAAESDEGRAEDVENRNSLGDWDEKSSGQEKEKNRQGHVALKC